MKTKAICAHIVRFICTLVMFVTFFQTGVTLVEQKVFNIKNDIKLMSYLSIAKEKDIPTEDISYAGYGDGAFASFRGLNTWQLGKELFRLGNTYGELADLLESENEAQSNASGFRRDKILCYGLGVLCFLGFGLLLLSVVGFVLSLISIFKVKEWDDRLFPGAFPDIGTLAGGLTIWFVPIGIQLCLCQHLDRINEEAGINVIYRVVCQDGVHPLIPFLAILILCPILVSSIRQANNRRMPN